MDESKEGSCIKKNQRLELRPNALEKQLTVINRKRPNIVKVERSSVLSRVRAFIPEMKKAETDLWQEMKKEVTSILNFL
jgi:hypothetical protein